MEQFIRTEWLLGRNALDKLLRSRVAVFGLGGVGGAAAEALTRSGVGALDLIDHDTVSVTNLNRQAIALHSTLGQQKVEAAAARLRDINPGLRLTLHPLFYLPEGADAFDLSVYDYIVDAIDNVSAKIALITRAQALGVPLISAMGAGNRLDPGQLTIGDIYETSACGLARVMRKELRKRGILRQTVAYSLEAPLAPASSPGENGRPLPGSTAFVPPAMGLLIASRVVRDLIGR